MQGWSWQDWGWRDWREPKRVAILETDDGEIFF